MTFARLGKPVLGLSNRACWLIAIALTAALWGAIIFLFDVVAGVHL